MVGETKVKFDEDSLSRKDVWMNKSISNVGDGRYGFSPCTASTMNMVISSFLILKNHSHFSYALKRRGYVCIR